VHLIDDLLGHVRRIDQPAGALRLGENEGPVGGAFGDRVAHIGPAGGYGAPVRHDASGGLWPAFEQVPRKASHRQAIQLLRRPAEAVDQGCQGERAVSAAAGNDDVGARGKGRRDREGAKVGVCAQDVRRQRSAALHVRDARSPQSLELTTAEIIAADHRDRELYGPAPATVFARPRRRPVG
jgi:hypothetical protein